VTTGNGRGPVQVAVIGGGCAAMAAAFELTRPEHGGRYRVTVYQLGWRLGGKGASGRGPAGRIEEHGLHFWLGWYENAFRLMRQCYAELGRDPQTCPIADWRDAFTPAPLIGVPERTASGDWAVWKAVLPPTEGLPGDGFEDGKRWSVAEYMQRSTQLLAALFATIAQQQGGASVGGAEGRLGDMGSAAGVLDRINQLLTYGGLASLAGLIQGVRLLELALRSLASSPDNNLLLRLLDAIESNARGLLERALEHDIALRRIWHVIDLTLASLRGEVRFGLMHDPRGFDAIDDYDCREWLLLNGASRASVDSGFLRALYDLGFSYEDGNPRRPRISAGQGLRGMVRTFFTYRGSIFWRMEAGMGDVVFAPFYEVLLRRGVRFEFFHRLEHVKLAGVAGGASPHVEALEFDVQAEMADGASYRPLVDVGGLPCWPSAPDWTQLADGERLRCEGRDFESHWDRRRVSTKTLRVTDDFDFVVLAVGIGVIPYVCGDVVALDPRWRAMVDYVKTVATQSFQLWLDADMPELGWPDDRQIVVCGFTEPFDTWSDMRHLIRRECWPRAPRGLAYFCNALPEADEAIDPVHPNYAAWQHERVRRNAVRFLTSDIAHLWPRAVDEGGFRWTLLADPRSGAAPAGGEERFRSQFWRANVNPTDRYTLSLPGSGGYRISPLDRTYDNLTIAGDWTSCGFNAGCVEAAVMSGMLAAHALSRAPRLEDIVGYDHP